MFSTADDNQSAVTVHVLQGERDVASANKSLGRFDLSDIPPARRGTPQIEVTFDIDANGILNVSAKDKATGKEQSIIIKASSGLSDEEVEKMVQDAEVNKEADQKFQELVGVRNQADSLMHATEKSMEELGDDVTAEEKEKIEAAITELKELVKERQMKNYRYIYKHLPSSFIFLAFLLAIPTHSSAYNGTPSRCGVTSDFYSEAQTYCDTKSGTLKKAKECLASVTRGWSEHPHIASGCITQYCNKLNTCLENIYRESNAECRKQPTGYPLWKSQCAQRSWNKNPLPSLQCRVIYSQEPTTRGQETNYKAHSSYPNDFCNQRRIY